jgi:GNAT superfamily N-acetyltransferase
MALDIRPLTTRRIPDLAELFGQGGDPRWCWCTYFRVRGRDWTNGTPDDNRAVLASAVRTLNRDDRAPGLVAFEDGVPIGWTSLGPRKDYERLTHSVVLAPVDATPVWSIVCFVVGRKSRGRGVATALLDAAIDYAQEHGATTLEAYPVDTSGDGRIASANVYRGTLSMFERAGFTVVAERQWNATSPVRPIVRLKLDGGR